MSFIFQKNRYLNPDETSAGIDENNSRAPLRTGETRLFYNQRDPRTGGLKIEKVSGAYFKPKKLIRGETERRIKLDTYSDGTRKNRAIIENDIINKDVLDKFEFLKESLKGLENLDSDYSNALRKAYQKELNGLLPVANQIYLSMGLNANGSPIKQIDAGDISKMITEAVSKVKPIETPLKMDEKSAIKDQGPEIEEVKKLDYKDSFDVFREEKGGVKLELPESLKLLSEKKLPIIEADLGPTLQKYPHRILNNLVQIFIDKKNIDKINKMGEDNLKEALNVINLSVLTKTGLAVNKVNTLKYILSVYLSPIQSDDKIKKVDKLISQLKQFKDKNSQSEIIKAALNSLETLP